jgi:tRNA A-37 threonylcarbamoyl transferase component Bud32
MKDYLAPDQRDLLHRHGLDSFAALWDLPLEAVDKPNVERGGWSNVARLELEGIGFFLKRQSNYLTRTVQHPLGEATVAREFRNIRRYARLGVPSLEAVFYGERKVGGECRAILLTRALDGWAPLGRLVEGWQDMPLDARQEIVLACADLVGRLHAARLRHGCLYPKHLFVRRQDGQWRGCLIDLEKTRHLWLTWRGRIKDLETFLRTVKVWSVAEQQHFLVRYLKASGASGTLAQWQEQLGRRRAVKDLRH